MYRHGAFWLSVCRYLHLSTGAPPERWRFSASGTSSSSFPTGGVTFQILRASPCNRGPDQKDQTTLGKDPGHLHLHLTLQWRVRSFCLFGHHGCSPGHQDVTTVPPSRPGSRGGPQRPYSGEGKGRPMFVVMVPLFPLLVRFLWWSNHGH